MLPCGRRYQLTTLKENYNLIQTDALTIKIHSCSKKPLLGFAWCINSFQSGNRKFINSGFISDRYSCSIQSIIRSVIFTHLTTMRLYLLQKCNAISPTLPPVTTRLQPASTMLFICYRKNQPQSRQTQILYHWKSLRARVLTLSSRFSAPGLNAFSSAALFMRTVP